MTTQWTASTLLEPLAGPNPCGEDLEDTATLAAFDAFRVFGQSQPLDGTTEWEQIQALALDALARSRDIRLLAHLGASSLRTDGVPAFCDVLEVVHIWLQRHWREVFPAVDEDAVLRRNALQCFGDPMAVIDALRRAPLARSRTHGTVTLRDLDAVTGASPTGSLDAARATAAFADTDPEERIRLRRSLAAALAAVEGVGVRMRESAGDDAPPDLQALGTVLVRMQRVLADRAPDATATQPGAGANAAAGAAAAAPNAVRSREDAMGALEAVARFFRTQEPSSPIPLLVERARRLVASDFLDVLADIAPDAVAQARAAGGLKRE